MDTTRSSLLLRIKDREDTRAWSEFHDLYAPLLYRYARARGLSHEDADDVRSTCYETIFRQIGEFQYDKHQGGFKAWLRTLVNRRVVDLLRKRREPQALSQELAEIPAQDPAPDALWEQHWRAQHLAVCVEQARAFVTPQTYQAFRLLTDEDCSVSEVCQRLEMTPKQVYCAKARILQLIRQQLDQLGIDRFA